jgi:uncharacterized protein
MTFNTTPEINPRLAQIIIYPIKSLDGIVVDQAQVATGGALSFDRRWAIVDPQGKVVNAKRTAKIQQLRSQFEFIKSASQLAVTLQAGNNPTTYTFCLNSELTEFAKWLSYFFGFSVSLIENAVVGFPDDLVAYGPTIISSETLALVCEWFPDVDLAEVRRRFRTNLEIDGVPALWEDRLFGGSGELVNFQIGDVRFAGINPCQRCIVPTRNSRTGVVSPRFQQIFSQQRQQSLPVHVNRSRFNHFYKLAINTQINRSDADKFVNTGDLLVLIKPD